MPYSVLCTSVLYFTLQSFILTFETDQQGRLQKHLAERKVV